MPNALRNLIPIVFFILSGCASAQREKPTSYSDVSKLLGAISQQSLLDSKDAQKLLSQLDLHVGFHCTQLDPLQQICTLMNSKKDVTIKTIIGSDVLAPSMDSLEVAINFKGGDGLPVSEIERIKIFDWKTWEPNFNDDFRPRCGIFRQLNSKEKGWVFRVRIQIPSTTTGCAQSSESIIFSANRRASGDVVQ